MRSVVDRALLVLLTFLAISCSASRQNGFSYRPAVAGPDIAGVTDLETGTNTETITSIQAEPANESTAISLTEEKSAMAADLAKIVQDQVTHNLSNEKPDPRKAVTDIAEAYTAEKNIQLTRKQWQKLDRYAAKLEKKQLKKAQVDWAPQNNLEIFILAAAGVGLVVGFFSAIGWFVFLVAALVYLYFKLLKD